MYNFENMRKILFVIVILSLIILVNAQYLKTFDEANREVTIKNSFLGIPTTDLAKVRLVTPMVNPVFPGKDRKVAEMEVDLLEDSYSGFINDMEFYNKYNDNRFYRDFVYKVKTVTPYIVEDSKQDCKQLIDEKNGSSYQECTDIIIGSHTEFKESWSDLKSLDISKGKQTIGIFTDVYAGDYVEWIPTMFDTRINEFASWNDTFNLKLMGYWTLNETAGVLFNNSVNNYALTLGNQHQVGGIIGGAYGKTDSSICNTTKMYMFGESTMNFWINRTAVYAGSYLIASYLNANENGGFALGITAGGGTGTFYAVDGAGNQNVGNFYTELHKWHMFTVRFNTSTATLYYDGALNKSKVMTNRNASYLNTVFLFGDISYSYKSAGFVIDELSFWNRSLSESEINDLYNGGAGMTWKSSVDAPPIVSINSPSSANYTTSPQSLNINCSATDDNEIKNITLYVNSVYNYSLTSSGTTYLNFQVTRQFGDGDYNLQCVGVDNVDNTGQSDVVKIGIDSQVPVLNLTYPINNSIFLDNLTTSNMTTKKLNWTVNDTHLASCVYSLDGKTNITVVCSSNSTTMNLSYATHSVVFFANDTYGNYVIRLLNFTNKYNILVNNQTYNLTSYETMTEYFDLNVTSNGEQTVTASLVYNGSLYSGTKYGDNFGMIFRVSHQELVPGNNSFYWNISFGSSVFSTTTYYQNVKPLIINLCNSTLNVSYVNYTFKDEVSLIDLNASIDVMTMDYGFTTASDKTFTFSNTTAFASYGFCVSPSDRPLKTITNIQYSYTGYPQRRYYANQTLTNQTYNKTLYLLATASGLYSSFNVVNNLGNALSGVTVTAERQIGGTYIVIEQGTTDSSGIVTFWLNPNYDHRITSVKSGYATSVITIRPTQTTYSIILSTGTSNITYYSPVEGIYYTRTPPSGYIVPGLTTFTFNITSSKGNMMNCKFELVYYNGTIADSTSTPCTTNALLTITRNIAHGESIFGKYYVDMNGTYLLLESDGHWLAIPTNSSSYGTLKSFLVLLGDRQAWGVPNNTDYSCHRKYYSPTNFTCDDYVTKVSCEADTECFWGIGDDNRRWEFTMIVVIFFTLALVGAATNIGFQYDLYNPGYFIWIVPFILLIISIAGQVDSITNPHGLLYIEGATFLPFFDNYIISIYAFIIAGIIYLRSNRVGA